MIRLPVATSVDPETSNGDINFGAQSTNVIYDRYPNGEMYATQRPSFKISQDPANFSGLSSKGRGIYFWDAVGTFVIVNDSFVEFGYGLSVGSISSGRDPVYFVETVTLTTGTNLLIILDPENNQGWYIEADNPTAVTEIDDALFPPKQTPARQLAGGGVFLDGFLFVMDTDGNIWNSAINDPLTWNGDVINASREADGGTYLAKHHDNLVAISRKSIEFFYNAANPTQSPLGVRRDISYRTGVVDKKSVFVTGDKIFLIGSDRKSTNGLFEIQNFRLNKRSSWSIDRFFSDLGILRDYDFLLSNAAIDDHIFIFITAVDGEGSNEWNPIQTIVFDAVTGMWTQFRFDLGNVVQFPVIDVADKLFGTERNIELLLTNGIVLEVSGSLNPVDSNSDGAYWEDDDYMEDNEDYVATTGEFLEDNIFMSITLPEVDFGTDTFKFMHYLWVVGTTLANADKQIPNEISVSWTDDHYTTFSPPRLMSTDTRRKLTRLGRFRRRGFKVDYEGSDTLRIEALELGAGVSMYA